MSKHTIQFSHANGFPASSYAYLFDRLDNSQISFVDKMGHGDYPVDIGYSLLADELIASVEQSHTAPVIGMGHSAGGAVTLMAASKRPDLFSQVIVMEPVLFSKRKRLLAQVSRAVGLGDWIGPTKRTLIRKSQFDHHEQAFDYFSGKTLFKNFHPECFKDYIKYGLTPAEQGFELAFSTAVEADIFRSFGTKVPDNIDKLKGVLLYGSQSKVFWPSDVRWWQKHYPNFILLPVDGEHLFPLEQPEMVAGVLNQYLNESGVV